MSAPHVTRYPHRPWQGACGVQQIPQGKNGNGRVGPQGGWQPLRSNPVGPCLVPTHLSSLTSAVSHPQRPRCSPRCPKPCGWGCHGHSLLVISSYNPKRESAHPRMTTAPGSPKAPQRWPARTEHTPAVRSPHPAPPELPSSAAVTITLPHVTPWPWCPADHGRDAPSSAAAQRAERGASFPWPVHW